MPDYSNHTITSRMEEILYDMVHDLEYTGNPQSVVEALLLDLNFCIILLFINVFLFYKRCFLRG